MALVWTCISNLWFSF